MEGNKWYIFAERSKGIVTREFGPDPRVSHESKHYELYLLTYELNDGEANKVIQPKIEKIADEDVQNGFSESERHEKSKYLPPEALFAGFVGMIYQPDKWAYTDHLQSESFDYNNDIPKTSRGLVTKEDLNSAEKDGIRPESIKRIFRNDKFTLLVCTEKDNVGHYIAPFVIYNVETHQKYTFPPAVDDIDTTPLYSKDGSWFFRQRHQPGNMEGVFKLNPLSGETLRWYLDIPSELGNR